MRQSVYHHASGTLRRVRLFRACVTLVLLLGVTLLGSTAGFAGTPVARGDVLRVEVLNAPELSREAAVDVDGRITLPMLGAVEVADRDTDDIRKVLVSAFREGGLLTRPDVLVEIASYRRIYVGGSVGRPGAIDFVPGLTARQALIAAGGLRLGPANATVSPEDILSAMAQRRALEFRFAQTVAEIARLRAELSGARTLADPTKDLVGIAPAETEDIVAAAGAFLTEVLHRNEARQQHGRELIDLIALELRTLEDQASLQTEESEVQKNEIENARDLVDRGLLPRPRLTELLRVQSQLSQNRLANAAFAARARQAAETVRFEELNETMQNRETVRRNLSLARAQKSDIAAKISEIDLRILAAGGGAADARNITPQLIIFRKTNGMSVQIDDAGLDDTVQPGDVLELGIQIPDGPEIPTPKIPTIERSQGATSGRPNAAGITVGMGTKP